MNALTFSINVAEFLDFKTGMPDLYNISVRHLDGQVTELSIGPSILEHIKDVPALLEHVNYAAKNNYESYKSIECQIHS